MRLGGFAGDILFCLSPMMHAPAQLLPGEAQRRIYKNFFSAFSAALREIFFYRGTDASRSSISALAASGEPPNHVDAECGTNAISSSQVHSLLGENAA